MNIIVEYTLRKKNNHKAKERPYCIRPSPTRSLHETSKTVMAKKAHQYGCLPQTNYIKNSDNRTAWGITSCNDYWQNTIIKHVFIGFVF